MNQMASEEGTMAGVWKSTNVFKQLITVRYSDHYAIAGQKMYN